MNPAIRKLPVLVLDVHSRCNCRCVMCDIWKRDSVQEFHPDDLERQLPAIEKLGVEWVVLTGGEPLMHSGLFRISGPLRERGIRITLLTTGLLLSRYAEAVARGIDDVIVSLDGPPEIHDEVRRVRNAFERLRAGVGAVRSFDEHFPITARSTVQRINAAHLTRTVQAARDIGCDSISFLAADTHSSAFNRTVQPQAEAVASIIPTAEDIPVLATEVERLIASGECGGYIAESPAKLRRIVDHFRCAAGEGEPIAPACNAPWVSAVMDSAGLVRPCFFHRAIGRAGSGTPLDAVINGPEALAFRGSLDIAANEICRRCVCSLNWKGNALPAAQPAA